MKSDRSRYVLALPLLAAVLALAALIFWWTYQGENGLSERLPGADQPPGAEGAAAVNPVLAGKLIQGRAQPANLPGLWPQFRGPNRNGISAESTPLARSWDAAGPRKLWEVDCGEGYAGAAVERAASISWITTTTKGKRLALSVAGGRRRNLALRLHAAYQAKPRDDPHHPGPLGPICRGHRPQVPCPLP